MLDKLLQQAAWQLFLRTILLWLLILLLGGSLWFFLGSVKLASNPGIRLVGCGAITILEAACLAKGLALTPLHVKARYRLAFLVCASLPGVIELVQWRAGLSVPVPAAITFVNVFAVPLLAAFMGCLLASNLQEGLWENNSPPPTHIQEDVHRWHQATIGVPGRQGLAKRSFDICVALFGILIAAPVWMLSAFLIWFEDPGPLLFVKNSVGKGGKNFHQYKFRTMVRGAEELTGPVMSQEGDQRVLFFGRLLRKTALDELPQLINILRGEMSFVGPRPQRTVLVHTYLQAMPEYAERHRVLPGLSGLAQVAGDYYLTPRQKLRFDRLYIRHASLGFDLKLLFLAFLITFWFRWRSQWDGRLPRELLRLGSTKATHQ